MCGKYLTLERDDETLKTFPIALHVQTVAYTIDVSANGFLFYLHHFAHFFLGVFHAVQTADTHFSRG